MSSCLVVFSIDLIITRLFEVMGEFACFKGLKFKMALRILLAVWGRVRMRMEREFKVASIRTASLRVLVEKEDAAESYIPRIFVEYCQQPVKQPRCFGLKVSRCQCCVVRWDDGKRYFMGFTTLQSVSCNTYTSTLTPFFLPVDQLLDLLSGP